MLLLSFPKLASTNSRTSACAGENAFLARVTAPIEYDAGTGQYCIAGIPFRQLLAFVFR